MGKKKIEIKCSQLLGEVGLHGQKLLLDACPSSDVSVRIGTYEDKELKALVDSGKLHLELKTEAYAFGRTDLGYTLAGFDEKGLMYGCQELSDCLSDGAGLADINFSGKPFTKTRGLYTFLHNKDLEEEWF